MTFREASDSYVSELTLIVNEAGVWVRRSHPVDAVLCAFISRIFEVYRSVTALAEKNRGHDAQILPRSALELFLELRYLTNTETLDRTYRFAEFEAKQLIKARKDFLVHFPNSQVPTGRDLSRLEVTASKFPSAIYWQYREVKKQGMSKRIVVNLREMVREPEFFDSSLGPVEWAYDIAYAIASSFVHPRPLGLRAHIGKPGELFKVGSDVAQGRLSERSLVLTVFSVALIVKRVLLYWGLSTAASACDELYKRIYKPALDEISVIGGTVLPPL